MAVPSRRPSTAWTWTLGLPSGPTAISPFRDATSTWDGLAFLRLPVEERKLGTAEGADRSHLRPAEALIDRKVLQATHRFVPLLQDNREGALAVRLMKQFAQHALPPFRKGLNRQAG
jgi:hypothetical protein